MDCFIDGHSVRPFCAAIGCLSRVGKEINIDFDPIDGLTLRSLNDSKSIFSSFHYEPSFFQRCSSPPLTSRKRRKSQDDDDDEEDRWSVRVSIKSLAPLIRPRKDVLSLQIATVGDLLSFEFQMQRASGVIVRIIHRVGFAPAQSVAAVASTESASEIVVQPQVLLTMLEPLKRATEIALLVNETHKLVSSVTFAHDDIAQDASSNLAKPNSLKTETSIGYDELIDLEYVSHPDASFDDDPIPPPADLKEQVVLVFTLKEFKSMLQFCSQAVDQSLPVSISFFWGGKPMVVKTNAEGFSGQLVMATLDHKLMASMKTSSTSGPAPDR
eukprot:scaffold1203_cov117-Cylindrotheca_fusiformis.AAC.2